MLHSLDIKEVSKKSVTALSDKFYGKDKKNGTELSFNNYYMMLDGNPFLGVSGECHYARVCEDQWEDTLLKMKMGGINIISTYVFWIHHEEEEGKFRFDGNRNLRKFVQLCQKYGLYVIVRIGPFAHGEVRNGGFPDWLYGKPFETRSTDAEFLAYVRMLYRKIAEQLEGLYFKDGGPIIAAQIDNEYMHSAAPWEFTNGTTKEWIPGGHDGNAYMLALKRIAQEEGILTPFYTCTGWGGAATPTEEMLPLWGGYAFWPWIYYDYQGEHPATPEYLYRDKHNDHVRKTYNFEPFYEPESMPYACCEMGGGMTVTYQYRFQLPYESVDSMANIKLAEGCNFVGYYMYRGGSNPRGEKTLYLNEGYCPKISYDYQAPIGEFGQLRPSYYRLKALHLFLKNFGEQFCDLTTVLPENSQEIKPEDTELLRYAVRTDGEMGFLFLNNYQDHVVCKDKKEETMLLDTKRGRITFPEISISAGETAILPFGMNLDGYRLICATAQPLAVMHENGKTQYFFFAPEGMQAEYVFEGNEIHSANGKAVSGAEVHIRQNADDYLLLDGIHGQAEIFTLSREQSLQFYQISFRGREYAVLSPLPILCEGECIRMENRTDTEATMLKWYPENPFKNKSGEAVCDSGKTIDFECLNYRSGEKDEQWEIMELHWNTPKELVQSVMFEKKGDGRYKLRLPERNKEYKDWMLRISYDGDVAYLFENGTLISDNFNNGTVWEIGLKEALLKPEQTELTLLISPKKVDASVVSSAMAGRMEQTKEAMEGVYSIEISPVREQMIK